MSRMTSPIRTAKIIQGRTIWKSTAGNRNERLHDFFKYVYLPEDGFSQYELEFIIYQMELALDHKLTKETLSENLTADEELRLKKYKEYIETTLSIFRGWLENEGLILVTENTEDGMIVYNIMTKQSLDEANKKLKIEEEALKTRQERNTEIYAKGRRKRVALTENLSKEIALRNKRKNKKRYGDFGAGE